MHVRFQRSLLLHATQFLEISLQRERAISRFGASSSAGLWHTHLVGAPDCIFVQGRPSPTDMSEAPIFQYLMTKHRSLVVGLFALPLSTLWDLYIGVRFWLNFWLRSAPLQHSARVAKVVEQVKARAPGKRMVTGRPGWQSVSLSYRSYKKDSYTVDALCDFIDIIAIDTTSEAPTVTVEPLVTVGQLTHALLPRGFTLPVVPEMDDLTVGGLVNGTGIESSSHIHGLFHEQCESFEVCLADGTVIRASKSENADLFNALPWSYGTLGMLLSVTLRIVPCKPYVRLTYFPYTDQATACAHFAALSSGMAPPDGALADGAVPRQPEYVEALAFSKSDIVVMAGVPVDAPPRKASGDEVDGVINSLRFWFKPWFFKHVESKLTDMMAPTVEYIPLRDYYHRHTRSMFWEMELMFPIGNLSLVRLLTGWMLPPKVSFLKLTQTEVTRRLTQETHVAQDFMLPMRELPAMLNLCDEQFGQCYPNWLCPHIHRPMPGTIMPPPHQCTAGEGGGSEMYVDLGVYGLPRCVKERPVGHSFDMRKGMRAVEARLREIGGVEMLYADNYQTREEFEQMFPHEEYRRMRRKYGCEGVFPEVYQKINVIGVSSEPRTSKGHAANSGHLTNGHATKNSHATKATNGHTANGHATNVHSKRE